jgi:hypothetical protein
MLQRAAYRVKNSVLPSGENVGEPSFAEAEIAFGANNSATGRAVPCASKPIGAQTARAEAILFKIVISYTT